MIPMKRVTLIVVLCWYIVSTESASISMQLSSPNIQNGSSLRVNVTFSPPLGNERFGRFGLSFAKQWKEFIIPDKSILLWNKTINRISFHKNLPASEKARIQIVSTNNPTSIDISSITFADDNRWLQAFVEYNDSSGINATNTLKAIATNARIKVYTPLVLYGMSPSILSREGNSANLKCTASARPAPSITWHYNSAAINATISTTTVTTTISNVTSVLKISSLTASANGQQVTCSATHHPYSPTINRTTTFNVQWIPDFIARPPITLAVNEGTNLQLQVTMGGNPKPSADFRWLHLTGSSSSNVQSVQLYPFVYSSTYTLNNIDASYCGRILQTSLKNSIGSLSDTASTNVTVLLNLDIDFGLKAGRIGGAKCVEVKWNKVEAGACYVNYEVVLKNASGSNEYSNSGYNIGMMTMCSFLTFSSVTDVQLTVSFKSTSRNISAKVSDTPLTTPTPTPTDTTYRSSSGVINTQTAEINIKETTRTAQPTSCVNNSGCNQASSDEWKSRDSAVLAVIVILIIMLIMLSVIIILMRRRLNSAISRKQTRQAGQAEIHYIDLGIPSREAESNNAKLQGEYGEVGRKNPQYVNM